MNRNIPTIINAAHYAFGDGRAPALETQTFGYAEFL